MFKRLVYDTGLDWIPILAFILTFGVFCVFVVRALRMKKSQVSHMSSLPLEGNAEQNSTPPDSNDE